ncbi:DNA adenine methylase [Treponema pedis]|uniref:DNA adenine methylase n=1 Tax=Treponema pedis TaxID=409322 RepID=UPI003D22A39F
MKTPLTYYGGKQQLASKIVALIPEHKIYCEPFIGGAAVFFAKPKSQSEIINDINSEIVNFYEVLQRDFTALQSEVAISLHSRKLHKHAQVIYENPDMFDRVKRAWAVWVLANMSFNNSFIAGFTRDKDGKLTRSISSKRLSFKEDLAIRLQNVQIECCDALRIIRSNDSPDTFNYIDPPYVGACQGHYDGYSQDDFNNLLKELSSIKGKFLLSSYRNPALSEAVKMFNWHQLEFKINNHPGEKTSPARTKIEVLTANYPLFFEK